MTSTITRTYERGDNASEVRVDFDEWCGETREGYRCSMREGHDGPQHVAMYNDGEVCHVWDNEPPNPRAEVEAFQRHVVETAKYVVDDMGYGSHEVFAGILAKLGIRQRTFRPVVRLKAAQRVTLARYTGESEDDARDWAREHAAEYASSYDWTIDTDDMEVTVEETTPDEDADPVPGADTDDLEEYKALVRQVAIEAATDNDWCDNGLNGVLDRLGLPHKTRRFEVEVSARVYRTAYVTVEATTSAEAQRMVTNDQVREALDGGSWEYDDDWDVEGVEVV